MIRNIVFDIGNVLAAFQWDKKFKQHILSEDIFTRVAKATVLSDMWKEYDRGVLREDELMKGFISNEPELEPLIRKCVGDYNGMLGMYDYTIPWIRALKEKGYKVFYLSNMPERATRDCADDMAFIYEMDGGVLSWRERVIKPDIAIYQMFLERFALKPEECVFLDDAEKI